MLGKVLSDIKSQLSSARNNKKKIVEISAAAHVGILRLHPFLGANTRTAFVITNAILRYADMPAIWFDDGNEYRRAIFEDLQTPSKSANFYTLLLKNIDQINKNTKTETVIESSIDLSIQGCK